MKRLGTVVLATIAGLWMAGNVFAEDTKVGDQPMKPTYKKGGGPSGGMNPGMGMDHEGMIARLIRNPKIAEEVGLTADQVAALKTKLEEIKKEEQDLKEGMDKAGKDQAELMTSKSLDENAIMAAIDKIAEKRTAFAKLQARKMILLRKTLTEEQIQKIRDIMKRRMENKAEGKGEKPDGESKGPGPGTTQPNPLSGEMKPIQ